MLPAAAAAPPPDALDIEAATHFRAGRSRLLSLAARDADFWYSAAQALALFPGSRDDASRATVILAMLRSFVPEQKHHDPSRAQAAAALGSALGSGHFEMHVHVGEGAALTRATPGARDVAIELERAERARLESDGPAGSPQILYGPPVNRPVA